MQTSTSGPSGSHRHTWVLVLAPVVAVLAIAVLVAAVRSHASSSTPRPAYASQIPQDALAEMQDATGIVVVAPTQLAPTTNNADAAVDAAIGPLGIPRKDQVKAVQLVEVKDGRGDVLTGRTMWMVYGAGVAQRQFGPGGEPDSGKAVIEVGASMAFVDPSSLKLIETVRY